MTSFVRLSLFSLLTLAVGCAETAPKPATVPTAASAAPTTTTTTSPTAPTPPNVATRPELRTDTVWVAPQKTPDWDAWDKVATLAPKAPARCALPPKPKKAPEPVCSNATELASELASTFAAAPIDLDPTAASRGKLVASLERLESCAAAPPGFIRALRAELMPFDCADVLTDPIVKTHPANMEPAVAHQLVGLSLAAKLARMGTHGIDYKGGADKASVKAYLTGPFAKWFGAEARTIESLSSVVAHSERSCGQGIAAVEAGVADMRFVDLARKAPIPDAMKNDKDLSSAYYGALDEVLEPRKARGRDAALVGLEILAQCGYVHDAHVEAARNLIESMYAGKRVVALSGLVFPPQTTAAPNPLLLALPAFYADRLVGTPDEAALAAWAIRGMPPAARASLEGRIASTDDKTRLLYARARLASGIAHVRLVDFDRSVSATWAPGQDQPFETDLGLVLRKGPASAAELMRATSPGVLKWRDAQELDALGALERPESPYAEYDAAYLGLVAPPDGADAAYFDKLRAKFDHVAGRTQDAALKALAQKRSAEMQDTAKSVRP